MRINECVCWRFTIKTDDYFDKIPVYTIRKISFFNTPKFIPFASIQMQLVLKLIIVKTRIERSILVFFLA
ncbi:MAG: hypothetical protein RL329_1901 [Bacteroidota bacterium]|jgi:hypothetical protein